MQAVRGNRPGNCVSGSLGLSWGSNGKQVISDSLTNRAPKGAPSAKICTTRHSPPEQSLLAPETKLWRTSAAADPSPPGDEIVVSVPDRVCDDENDCGEFAVDGGGSGNATLSRPVIPPACIGQYVTYVI